VRIDCACKVGLQAALLDDDPKLLEQSYRLRYQVYCVERGFLHSEDYPDQRERDAFDRHSVHVGAVDGEGQLAATARLVTPNGGPLPLFQYCTLFPSVDTLDDTSNAFVEVSRVSISRAYDRHRFEDVSATDRRLRYAEPFLTLLKAVIYGARQAGATHLIGATDAALHRRLVRFGFPYRVAGPTVDYYGPVAPHIMSLADLDEAILGGQYPALIDFPIGGESAPWPKLDGAHIAWQRSEGPEVAMSSRADS
jgi:N-acyl amino acid synthase of PEP-CTERM/exosortase system